MDPLEGHDQAFETADSPLTENMQIRHDVQRQLIKYLADALEIQYPYKKENEYAVYVVVTMGPIYNMWYKKSCGSMSCGAFVKEYFDKPKKLIEDMENCSNVDKYVKNFCERFKKKIRKKMKLLKKTDISELRKATSQKASSAL